MARKTQKQFAPIITSLLDLDFYKLTMGYVVFLFFNNIILRFAFKNRTKSVQLPSVIPLQALKEQLDHIRQLRFTEDELRYLQGLGHFSPAYIEYLRHLKLADYDLVATEETFLINITGSWLSVMLWETLILSTVNELYYIHKYTPKQRLAAEKQGMERLWKKIGILKENLRIKFSDFGTRRRYSKEWQKKVVQLLFAEVPDQFLGTSNVALAMELGLTPIGTFAHEMFMAFQGIYYHKDDKSGRFVSHRMVLDKWREVFGNKLSIALTDTYGTEFFFRDFTLDDAVNWAGLRHDSGDPFEFGEKAIKFYEKYGIDPAFKTIVYSDGLDIETIVKLHNHFQGRINVVFGWGTTLTNDLGFETLSLVAKVASVFNPTLGFWVEVVKLSDNIAKATGSESQVQRAIRFSAYNVSYNEQPIV